MFGTDSLANENKRSKPRKNKQQHEHNEFEKSTRHVERKLLKMKQQEKFDKYKRYDSEDF